MPPERPNLELGVPMWNLSNGVMQVGRGGNDRVLIFCRRENE
jgi:hypothetical protein